MPLYETGASNPRAAIRDVGYVHAKFPRYEVRPAIKEDIKASNPLCRQVHGFNRGGELREAIDARTARVVERQRGRLLCSCGRRDHQGLEAMIGASPAFPGPRHADDLDNRRPLQRARRSLSPIGTVLKFLRAPTDFLVGPSGEA
jgi:hypothetical protein